MTIFPSTVKRMRYGSYFGDGGFHIFEGKWFISFGGYIYMNEVKRFGAFVIAIFASFCEA